MEIIVRVGNTWATKEKERLTNHKELPRPY